MKSNDEIKKGLECCAMSSYRCEDDCPYREQCRYEQGGKAMNEDALALIQQLEAQVPRWISMEEMMPEHGAMVLCHTSNYIEVLQWHEKDGLWFGMRTINSKAYVTHWMPLPEPPKEE